MELTIIKIIMEAYTRAHTHTSTVTIVVSHLLTLLFYQCEHSVIYHSHFIIILLMLYNYYYLSLQCIMKCKY